METGIGCEACHGAGAKHVQSKSRKDIWNFTGKTPAEQSRMRGYCHIRLENEMFKTSQGTPREDFPAPKVGDSFKPWDDWTKWYPEHVVIPGVQPQNPFDKQYDGDLNGLFIHDEVSKKNGVYEEAKHHQEYQGFIQSKHYKAAGMSCLTCHLPHATKAKKVLEPEKSRAACHDASFTVEKYVPGTGKTPDNLFVRSHAFVKDQQRKGLPTYHGVPLFYK